MTAAALPWRPSGARVFDGATRSRALAIIARAALVALAVAALAAPGSAPAPAAAAHIVALANDARAENGRAPLTVSVELSRAALAYAEEMAAADSFAHTGAGGSTLVDRGEAAGYRDWSFLGENLARGPGAAAPSDVVERWLASPGHRDNLLSPDATDTGAACATRAGRFWCVQLFGRR